ncbi:nicotinamidase [Harpegnathos saltator]|uniref:nicotinamidase n=1 Tax=Harpegnathos saltator TaxID=610380 RepID=E2C1G6_HARSA|nr:nicotinamidase [Harpegnathos saltator]EFN78142.1 Nicotinamidase [Harpegnathos saltator]
MSCSAYNDNAVWNSPMAIRAKFDTDADGLLNYKEFLDLCVELFGMDEVKEHELQVREIFKLFDTDADGTLDERELHRCYEWIHTTANPINVLVVVDVQNDFIDGALALRNCGYNQEAAEVVEPINRLLKAGRWDRVIYTLDWHPEDHISFFDNLMMRELHPDSKVTKKTAKVFDTVIFSQPHIKQVLWPKHCVKGTWGAELHKDLLIMPSSKQICKGQDSDIEEYSAFGANDNKSELTKILLEIGATHLYVCGLAYDVCVKETCLRGLQLNYRLAVVDDCCRGANPSNIEIAKNTISESGGLVVSSERVLSLVNKGERSLIMAHHAAKNMS